MQRPQRARGKDRTERRYILATTAVHLTWLARLSSVSIEILVGRESLNHAPVFAAAPAGTSATGVSVLGASTLGSAGVSAGADVSSGWTSVGFAVSDSRVNVWLLDVTRGVAYQRVPGKEPELGLD